MTSLKLCAVAVIACAGFLAAQDQKPEPPKVASGHEFLKRFVGEWDGETEAFMEPGKPPTKSKGSMTGQMIGELWASILVKGDFMGQPYHGQGTFGYDSKKKKYVGTWVDSMSEFMWKYTGVVDGDKLVLDSEGPSPTDPAKMVKARDTWEFKGKDQILLTGEMEGPDGKMMTGVKVTCTRKK